MTEKNNVTINTWESKILRKAYGPVTGQGFWKFGTNHEPRELHKTSELEED
jgi:hypothetical protein